MRNFIVVFLAFVAMLVTFSAPMNLFLHYTTILQIYALNYPEIAFPVAGILWALALYEIVAQYFERRTVSKFRFWVIDEKYLNEYNGFYEGPGKPNPVIVKEVFNEADNS